MSSEAKLVSEPANPSIADLASDWRSTWATPKTGPSYVSPTVLNFFTDEQKAAEVTEKQAYANMIHGVASRIVEASGSSEQRQVLDDSLRTISSPPSNIPLDPSSQLAVVKDVLDMTVSMMSQRTQ